jgi:hypothetical protein
MTKTQAKKFQSLLIKGCNAHIKAGGRIISSQFTSDFQKRACCPIGCTVPRSPSDDIGSDYDTRLSDKLGFEVTKEDFWAFVYAFDDTTSFEADSLAAQVGRELRKKYIEGTK